MSVHRTVCTLSLHLIDLKRFLLGQGLTALIALGILDALEETGKVDLSKYEEGSAEWLHVLMYVSRPAEGSVN